MANGERGLVAHGSNGPLPQLELVTGGLELAVRVSTDVAWEACVCLLHARHACVCFHVRVLPQG